MVQRNIKLHGFLPKGNSLMSNKVTFPFFAVTISVSRDFYSVTLIFLFSTCQEMDGHSLCFWKPPLLNQNQHQLVVLEYRGNTQRETCALQSLTSQDPVSKSAKRQALSNLPCSGCATALGSVKQYVPSWSFKHLVDILMVFYYLRGNIYILYDT